MPPHADRTRFFAGARWPRPAGGSAAEALPGSIEPAFASGQCAASAGSARTDMAIGASDRCRSARYTRAPQKEPKVCKHAAAIASRLLPGTPQPAHSASATLGKTRGREGHNDG